MVEKISNIPIAENFMETARSFGNYDLALALADIIDNSISAGAMNIHVDANYDTDEIRISDDGSGMDRNELITAMRVGSKNPKDKRSSNDLGRFGLGLKSASFSQADRLIVLTNKNEEFCGAEWDLNDCANFQMKLYDSAEALEQINSIVATKNGTEVIWRELTRLRQGSAKEDAHEDFNRAVSNAVDEIGLIFHRYLIGETTTNNEGHVRVFFNNNIVEPIDPFCRSNPKTQRLSQNSETVNKEAITFTPFTLPEQRHLTPEERQQLGGKEGFTKNAGFYIYRNKRLIIRGTWFKLVPFGELSKLSRVMVDIPNSLDEDWKITVDKSGVQLPGVLRKRLSNWIENRVTPPSKRVFRGRAEKDNIGEPLWAYTIKQGVGKFHLQDGHPVIKNFLSKLDKAQVKDFHAVMRTVESLLPIDDIRYVVSDKPLEVFQGYIDNDKAPDDIKKWALELALEAIGNGKTKTEILLNLSITQPFSIFREELERHLEKSGVFKA